MATRLIPHSVSRYLLFVVLSFAALKPPRQMIGPATSKSTRASSVGQRRPLRVHHLEVNQRHVTAVGLQAFRPGMECELDGRRLARRLDFLLRDNLPAFGGNGLDCAGGKRDLGKRVNIAESVAAFISSAPMVLPP